MSKFTKGEWRVELTKYGNIESAMVFYPHGFLTAANVIENDESRLEGESWLSMRKRTAAQRKANELESIANMHLISAAPNMRQELTLYISLLDDLIEDGMIGYIERRNTVLAVLNKADGKG